MFRVATSYNFNNDHDFDNGIFKLYDCRPLFDLPQFHLLRTEAFFRAVRVDPGGYGISWNDDIDLSEYELWTRGSAVCENLVVDIAASPK